MKIVLVVVGKTTQSYYQQAIDEYHKRINHYLSFELVVIPELKNTKSLTLEQQKQREGDLILRQLSHTDTVVLLDERGREFTSRGFAEYIDKKQHALSKRLVLVIGGPYGFGPEVYKAAHEQISLSRMTFSHQMIRMILVEQLYRAMSILNNEPYHHD